MFLRKFVFVCTLQVCLAGAAFSQSAAGTTIIPLVVDKGFSLQLLLTDKLEFKQNNLVHATVVEPIYAFDREVIPVGAQVEGSITGFEKAGKWKRISSMLGGDFTPLSEPQITFSTLILPDGDRIPIETFVVPGTEKIVETDNKHAGDLTSSLIPTAKTSTKQRLKNILWGMAPYHPRYLPVGTRLSAVLSTPLDFGVATFEEGVLDEIGSEPPSDSLVSVRLVTPLNSRTTTPGSLVEAQLTRPLFSPDHRLIFPVGSTVRGKVTQVKAASAWHHNGQLAFILTSIQPPELLNSVTPQSQNVEASLVSIQVAHDMRHVRINEDGQARIVESKKRFISPAWGFIKAGRSLNNSADSFGEAMLGAYRGKFLKQATGGGPGFGLPASISGAMVPGVGIGLSFYVAARSLYSNFLGRGLDISLPDNTPMEIRLDKADSSPR
jgi:hypothetical protein